MHSIWFGVLSELGYPGFVLFIALFGSSVWSLWSTSRKVRNDPEKQDIRIYANALLTSLVTFAVGGTFLPLQYNEMFWHFMALGMTLRFLAQEQVSEVTAPVRAPVPKPAPFQPAFLTATRSTLPK